MSNSPFHYIDAFGWFSFEALSEHIAQQVRQEADKLATGVYFYPSDQVVIDTEHPGDYSEAVNFLKYIAAIVKNANGEIQCLISDEIGHPIWDFLSVQDGKLLCQKGKVVREDHIEEVTEVRESDLFSRDNSLYYRGHLCFSAFTLENKNQLDHCLKKHGIRESAIQDNCFEHDYLGRDINRWYLRFLIDLAGSIGSNTLVQGEVEVSIEIVETGPWAEFYEFYWIEGAKLYRQKGTIHKGEAYEVGS